MPAQPLLISISQAARLLGVSRPTIYKFVREGRLERIELGSRTVRLRLNDVRALAGLAPVSEDEQ